MIPLVEIRQCRLMRLNYLSALPLKKAYIILILYVEVKVKELSELAANHNKGVNFKKNHNESNDV